MNKTAVDVAPQSRAEASASYPAKGKSVIRYSRNISIVSCPTAILFFLLIQLFIENIIPKN
ncbi:hypothetical protein FE768_16560 [Salmonella enterica subsp. enterica serovar Apeyeme]|nr:hypothetical protein [Salmonella enterica subsp. enterica serovar Apeyeme]